MRMRQRYFSSGTCGDREKGRRFPCAAQLFEIRSWDPHVFGFSILALGACSAVASVLPAGRAASTDPLKALRTE
jgi:hypothetical protein